MATLLQRLDAHDRALFARWVLQPTSSAGQRRFWIALTHLGGSGCTISFAALPLLGVVPFTQPGALPLVALVASHAAIQALKRTTVRRRPSQPSAAFVRQPDRFSFPSGHATAAMAVCSSYASAFPELAPLLVTIAALAGLSRVVLGVHYPGDVIVGQIIALASAALLGLAL